MRLGKIGISDKICTSKTIKKGLELAANNGSLFAAGASLILSSTIRPLAILATPKTDKENKRLACAKSVASTLTGYLLMLMASRPVAKSIKKIDESPNKFLNPAAVKTYGISANSVSKSKSYRFATQIFKLGTGLLLAVPKSVIVCAMTPIILAQLFKPDNRSRFENIPFKGKDISFGLYKTETLPKQISKILNKPNFQKFADKYKDTNFALHMTALTDILTTLTFVHQTDKSKKIAHERKSALIYNSLISTGLSVAGGYALDKALDKPTEKFIEKFKKINASDTNLNKYIEGIRIAKPVLILGGIYYAVIPFISTFLADRAPTKS